MVTPVDIPNIALWIRSTIRLSRTNFADEEIEESLRRLCSLLTCERFGKRSILISEGKRTGYTYFIEQGLTRSYWLVNGDEITTSFSKEGSIVFSMDEMYYGQNSEEFVEAAEPLIAYAVEIEEFLQLMRSDDVLTQWWIAIHQNEYRRLHRSHKERLTLSARDRYDEFERQFPEISRRARLTDIASYLGISLSTLSRLRRL